MRCIQLVECGIRNLIEEIRDDTIIEWFSWMKHTAPKKATLVARCGMRCPMHFSLA